MQIRTKIRRMGIILLNSTLILGAVSNAMAAEQDESQIGTGWIMERQEAAQKKELQEETQTAEQQEKIQTEEPKEGEQNISENAKEENGSNMGEDIEEGEAEKKGEVTTASYSGFVTINGQLYYYDPTTGERLKGLQVINKNTYYFQKSGAAASGRQTINGLAYYFDPVTYKQVTGIVEVEYPTVKRKHYFLAEGGLASGWLEENEKKYYFSSPETGAIMLTGVQQIDGKTYYFDTSTGEAKEGICEDSKGRKYYYTLEGRIKTGLQIWDGNLYYCKATQSGAVQYGFQSVDDVLYFFEETSGAAWKDTSFTYGHINFTINEKGNVVGIAAEGGYENNMRVRLIMNGLSRLGESDVFCGAFTKEVCQESGLSQVQGASYEQAQDIVNGKYGTLIKESELRMGDMIFWRWDNCSDSNCGHWEEIHHVGFYMGKGSVLEAASTDGTVSDGGTVQVDSLRSYSGFEITYCARVAEDTSDDFLDSNLQHTTLGKSKNVKAVSSGKNKVTLTWDSVKDAEGYLIYAQKAGKYGYCGMTTTGTRYADTKALDMEYNFYWVFPYVKDASGKMHPSGTEKYVFAKGICPAVTNLKASSQTGGVKLSWTKSNGAEGYLVYGKTATGVYGYRGMTTLGTTFVDKKASKTEYNFYWVYPYHKNASGKMIVGGTPKYVYGKAK
ncbi:MULTISPECIES: NlpC/P60 family protein [Clostridia]|uniref:NlpC/P60 family protein n=1 Tax=Clostridia TaxID=186801 RepID=UPI0015FCF463|nr:MULTISPECIES: NlpC/P60 family protein [Clostridia]